MLHLATIPAGLPIVAANLPILWNAHNLAQEIQFMNVETLLSSTFI
jgi:hypothetical protein